MSKHNRIGATDMVVYAALVAAAEAGARCPTNDALCGQTGHASTNSAVEAIKRLVHAGIITVERFARDRVVTIAATGKKTAAPKCTAPHWRDIQGAAR